MMRTITKAICRLTERRMEMRIEKDGYVCHLGGTWCEISNKHGVVSYGDVELPDEGATEKYTEELLNRFIDFHSLHDSDRFNNRIIKRVAYDPEAKEYIQLRAVMGYEKYCDVQIYDNELMFIKSERSGCQYYDELLDWMRTNFEIVTGLPANVYRDNAGDCTNGGISAYRQRLYVVSTEKMPFEPEDIRECVCIEWRDIMENEYVDCKPLYFPKRWYMAGGNFIYTSDSRYSEITRCNYPIPIHDRYEGR